jgi:hypothetical protein
MLIVSSYECVNTSTYYKYNSLSPLPLILLLHTTYDESLHLAPRRVDPPSLSLPPRWRHLRNCLCVTGFGHQCSVEFVLSSILARPPLDQYQSALHPWCGRPMHDRRLYRAIEQFGSEIKGTELVTRGSIVGILHLLF